MNLLLWMLLLVPLVLALGATIVCGLKGRSGFLTFGVIVVALAATLAVGTLVRWDFVWTEGWEDVTVPMFVTMLLPTTIVLLVGAALPGKPRSWWVEHISNPSTEASAPESNGSQ